MNLWNTLHHEINIPLLRYLNSFTENKIIEKFVYVMSDFPIFFIPIFLFSYWIYYVCKPQPDNEGKKNLISIFIAPAIAVIVNIIIQSMVHMDRPEQSIEGSGKLILKHIPDASFPSDHASVSIAFLTALFLFGYKKFAWGFLVLFFFMNLSRIAGGVHWPFDVLVGCFIGIFSGFLIYKIKNFYILQKLYDFLLKIASYLKL